MRWLVFALCMTLASPARADEESPSTRFSQMKGLAGEWSGATDTGRALHISYRVISNGSVLVETFVNAAGGETMTVYHLDGGRLLATHYCALGNQPRFELGSRSSEARMQFRFIDATDLFDRAAPHQHGFWLEMLDSDTVARSETYVSDGAEVTETATLHRHAPSGVSEMPSSASLR